MAGRDPITYVQGLREMTTLLRAVPRTVSEQVRREISTAVQPLVERARDLAPRSERKKGGKPEHLADSINSMLRAKGILVGSMLEHAAVVHFGRQSTQRSRGGNVYTRALTPVSWLYPAADEKADEVRARLQPAIERAIDIAFAAAGAT